jgi:hypothetical protein
MYVCIYRLYDTLGVPHEPLTLIPPQFECPLPNLSPATFPPAMREPAPPALDQFDLGEYIIYVYICINIYLFVYIYIYIFNQVTYSDSDIDNDSTYIQIYIYIHIYSCIYTYTDEHFAKEGLRLAQLTNKCMGGEDDLEYFIAESGMHLITYYTHHTHQYRRILYVYTCLSIHYTYR